MLLKRSMSMNITATRVLQTHSGARAPHLGENSGGPRHVTQHRRLVDVESQHGRIDAGEIRLHLTVTPRAWCAAMRQVDTEPEARGKAERAQSTDHRSGLLHHDTGQTLERAGIFGHRQHLGRIGDRPVALQPASQDLGTDEASGTGVELGLEEGHHVTGVDGSAQGPLLERATLHLGADLGGEHLDAIPSAVLGAVQCRVGEADHRTGGVVGLGTDRDTDAGRDAHQTTDQFQWFTDRARESLGDGHDPAEIGGIIHDHDELVTAEATGGAAVGEHRVDTTSHHVQ